MLSVLHAIFRAKIIAQKIASRKRDEEERKRNKGTARLQALTQGPHPSSPRLKCISSSQRSVDPRRATASRGVGRLQAKTTLGSRHEHHQSVDLRRRFLGSAQ